jgi:hypothetical protein
MNARNHLRGAILISALMAMFAGPARAQTPTVATPVLSPAGGSFVDYVDITITTATPGATIYYTLDGTTPTTASDIYSPFAPIEIYDPTVVKAFATAPGYLDSAVATGNFVVTPLPTPTIHLRGKKSLRTTKASIKLRGTSTGAESVEYAQGDGDYKSARGTTNWSFKAKLLPGKNVFSVYASGEEEDSDPITVVVRRVARKN